MNTKSRNRTLNPCGADDVFSVFHSGVLSVLMLSFMVYDIIEVS